MIQRGAVISAAICIDVVAIVALFGVFLDAVTADSNKLAASVAGDVIRRIALLIGVDDTISAVGRDDDGLTGLVAGDVIRRIALLAGLYGVISADRISTAWDASSVLVADFVSGTVFIYFPFVAAGDK